MTKVPYAKKNEKKCKPGPGLNRVKRNYET